jgi:hypothetical protein
LRGSVYVDADRDGVKDSGEAGIADVVVYVDSNNNKVLDASEARTVADSTGAYRFGAVPLSSDVIVRQIAPSGYQQLAPANGFGRHANISTPKTVNGLDFGNVRTTAAARELELLM